MIIKVKKQRDTGKVELWKSVPSITGQAEVREQIIVLTRKQARSLAKVLIAATN